MIKILAYCDALAIKFESLVKNNTIKDFRVYLRKNENLYLYVIASDLELSEELMRIAQNIISTCEVEVLTEENVKEDSFYLRMFSGKSESKIILDNGRRRYSSVWDTKSENTNPCPVVTFYSYKGGMGRTTTLAAYASYLAINHKMKVVVIDCDIEAPGFTNFFLRDTTQTNQRNGFVEYVFDKEINAVSSKDIRSYLWEADHIFTDEGTIYVMPCGNLSSESISEDVDRIHLDDYVEGISRLNFANKDYSIEMFRGVLNDIYDQLKPDVILIDSKTGISDIMGIAVCNISDKVVGFFRGDAQSVPGLHFFMKSMMANDGISPFIVNSILPAGLKGRKLFEQFKRDVTDLCDTIDPFTETSFACYPISRVDELSFIGTQEEEIGEMSDMIRNSLNKEFTELFDAITRSLFLKPVLSDDELLKECLALQKKIIEKDNKLLSRVDLYADNVDIEKDLESGIFYFRRCMGDLLNKDKFLVIGNKGTGKSYLYKALRSDSVVNSIKRNTSKEGKYVFLYTIDRRNRMLHANKIDTTVSPAAKYRYWIIYTWNSIANDLKVKLPEFNIDTEMVRFKPDDTDTARKMIQTLINDEHYAQKVEAEFARLNEFLKHQPEPTYLNIIYDQLDEIVNVSDWNVWIPDLIKYWRMDRFSHISGKLFMRTDLFRTLSGINNINELANSLINIEWSKEEMFSYFFQLVLADGVDKDFWKIMSYYKEYDKSIIDSCKKEFENSIGRLTPIDVKSLIPMVYTYFGENVDVSNTLRMGNSYDWFYRNLKNADDTISLRPFISLVKSAITKRISMTIDATPYKPILYQVCYTDKVVRTKAVMEHYEDMLADMIGDKVVKYTFEYIQNAKEIRYKRISQREDVFHELLEKVILTYQGKEGMNGMTVDKLASLLIDNGIVCKRNYGKGAVYVFSFLYKYNLGLKGS